EEPPQEPPILLKTLLMLSLCNTTTIGNQPTPVETEEHIQFVNTVILAVLIGLAIIAIFTAYLCYYRRRIRRATGGAFLGDIEESRRIHSRARRAFGFY
ncbi:9502_t:CDS:1, partial [Acaulospora morrowiae]